MPVFEYRCSDCGRKFEKLVLSRSSEVRPPCPNCGSQQVEKAISLFGRVDGVGSSVGSSGSCAPAAGGG